jgi:hypothetical protein
MHRIEKKYLLRNRPRVVGNHRVVYLYIRSSLGEGAEEVGTVFSLLLEKNYSALYFNVYIFG